MPLTIKMMPHNINHRILQNVQMLPKQSFTSDLSSVKHVRDFIGRHLCALPPPRSEDKLWQMADREWRPIRTLTDYTCTFITIHSSPT
ncbi:hypothetical protein TNCV_4221481 [Trichonephila clavipes]|nr:hypothetical protein TNCV_4221481 [Trichonephila clavipes]